MHANSPYNMFICGPFIHSYVHAQFDMHNDEIGLIMCIGAFSYVIASLVLGPVVDKLVSILSMQGLYLSAEGHAASIKDKIPGPKCSLFEGFTEVERIFHTQMKLANVPSMFTYI